ncbi:hypothetical protein [Nonomuraea guangzhouensis]|uniref:DUF4179 domain-containing protein n=1 Tax=Nonomuraea guangzhouensis TaxID=1291555 RepID=A0ABW4GDA3_9ACTN|nr:hypothetical protein [Nonomuraea guangzhouensis]
MNKLDRMVSAIDPAAAYAEPAMGQGVHDLLAEIVATPPAPRRGRSPLRRPLLAGVAVAGLAAAAVVAAPMVSGPSNAAYAVTKNSDGTIQVIIKELQDPDGLEAKLKAVGITADVTFTEAGKQCARGRFVGADLAYDPPNTQNMTEQQRKEFDKPDNWRSRDVAAPISKDTFVISPRFMRPEETLVLEFRLGNQPGTDWAFLPYLAKAGSPVAPCQPVNADPVEVPAGN